MHKHLVNTLAIGALLGSLVGAAIAQPTLTNPGGGTGNAEMDHSRMGGGPQNGPRSGTPAPSLDNQGGGTGNAQMDHSRMGARGQGAGSPQGGRITGNSGDGPEVQHGHNPGAIPRRVN